MSNESLKVSLTEWEDARAFFKANPGEIKFRKGKKLPRSHSFFQFDGVVYVVNNTKHSDAEKDAGGGGLSRVKYAFNAQGERFVIKIGYCNLGASSETCLSLLKDLGQKLSETKERVVNKKQGESGILKRGARQQIDEPVEKKFYTLLKYLGDRNLFDELIDIPRSKGEILNGGEYLLLVFKAMMSVQYLHQKNIIHGDIKPENFMVNGHGTNRVVSVIDFDFSEILPSADSFKIKEDFEGSEDYFSPEILKARQYSLASDVYAFGVILKGLMLPEIFYKKLLGPVETRPTLIQAMKIIALQLNEIKNMPRYKALREEIEAALQAFTQGLNSHLSTYLPCREMAALRIHVPNENPEQESAPLSSAPLLSIHTTNTPPPPPPNMDSCCIPCRAM